MTSLPYFENMARVIELFDDELMLECLHRLELELTRRGKSLAASELRSARELYGAPGSSVESDVPADR